MKILKFVFGVDNSEPEERMMVNKQVGVLLSGNFSIRAGIQQRRIGAVSRARGIVGTDRAAGCWLRDGGYLPWQDRER